MPKLSAHAGATAINIALIATAGVLCWRFKRMAPALLLIFMVSSKSGETKKEETDHV